MSWRFPKYPVKNTQTVDLEDVNANFLEYAEELGGQLNEHNWKEGAIAATTSLEKDAAFAWHQGGAYDARPSHVWPGPTANSQLITARPVWTAISNCTLTFTSPDCLLWLHGSAQLNQGALDSSSGRPSNTGSIWGPAGASGGSTPTGGPYFVSVQLAIRLDGYVIPESIIGGTEIDNDDASGVRMPMMPLVTSIVFPVATGSHTVELVARTVGKVLEKGGGAQSPETSPLGFYVSSREMICLEMRR
tara:strand:- start:15607 stop:16347 length:741 start_codon:yes stop_codon:yes gene_type:complete